MFKDHFGNNITVALGKNRLQKTPNIGKMTSFRKPPCWPLCKGYSLYKMFNLGQTLTLSKMFKNRFYNFITVVLGKNRL